MSINERIKIIRDRLDLSTNTVSEWLNITPQRLRQKVADGIWNLEDINIICDRTGYSFNWICQGYGPEKESDAIEALESYKLKGVREDNAAYLTGKSIRPITVTVDRAGKELITYVAVKAQAGYMRGYGDTKYMEKLPAFTLPNFNDNGTFRMFEVAGDSMRQLGGGGLQDGDKVIGLYVEDVFSMKDNMVYVIVSTEGIVIKRIINRLGTADKMIVLKSDNKNGDYPNVILPADKIKEVWEYKAHISRQLNFATDLFEMINEIQVQQAKLSKRVDDMDSITRAIQKGGIASK